MIINNEEKHIYGCGTVMNSEYITYSDNIYHSKFIHYSTNVINGTDIIDCNQIRDAYLVFNSSFVNSSDKIVNSSNIANSTNIIASTNIFNTTDAVNCNTISDSQAVTDSESCTNVFHCTSCKNVQYAIFCMGIEDDSYRIFNKKVEPKHFHNVLSQMNLFFNDGMRMKIMRSWQLNTSGTFQYTNEIMHPLMWYNNISDDFIKWIKKLPEYDGEFMYHLTANIKFLED